MLLRSHDPTPAHQCKSVCPEASHETETEQEPRDGSGARSGAGERAEAGASSRGPWPWAPAVPALSRDPLTSHMAELSWHSSARGPGCGRHKESERAPGVRICFPRVAGTRRKPVVAASTATWRMAEARPAGSMQCPTISPEPPCCQLPTEDAATGPQTAGDTSLGPAPHAQLPSRPFPRLCPFSLRGGPHPLPHTLPQLAGLLLGERDRA